MVKLFDMKNKLNAGILNLIIVLAYLVLQSLYLYYTYTSPHPNWSEKAQFNYFLIEMSMYIGDKSSQLIIAAGLIYIVQRLFFKKGNYWLVSWLVAMLITVFIGYNDGETTPVHRLEEKQSYSQDILNERPAASMMALFQSYENMEASISSHTQAIESPMIRVYNDGLNVIVGVKSYYIKDFSYNETKGAEFIGSVEDGLVIGFTNDVLIFHIYENVHGNVWRLEGHTFLNQPDVFSNIKKHIQ